MSALPHRHYKTERDKLRDRAHLLIRQEIKAGRLPQPSTGTCVDCGGAGYCYDHRDYRKPLEVDLVCRACNNRRGPGLPLPEKNDNAETKTGFGKSAGQNWSGIEGGDGFEPLVAHLNGISAADLDSINVLDDIGDTDIAFNEVFSRQLSRSRTRRGYGSARADYFKKRDPWNV